MHPVIAILSGAGISEESGLSTFRDSGGLWETYPIEEVASIEGWHRNRQLVLDFYNKRRADAARAKPNTAHYAIAGAEKYFNIYVITQNVDDLHERSGSKNVLHLHGLLREARSEKQGNLITDIGSKPIHIGDTAEDGAQLRPNIVWFGEPVSAISEAMNIMEHIDGLIVAGTSLSVYPAANLIHYAPADIPKIYVDPAKPFYELSKTWLHICKKAGEGVPEALHILKEKLYKNRNEKSHK